MRIDCISIGQKIHRPATAHVELLLVLRFAHYSDVVLRGRNNSKSTQTGISTKGHRETWRERRIVKTFRVAASYLLGVGGRWRKGRRGNFLNLYFNGIS